MSTARDPSRRVDALARSTMANAVVQLAVHFPGGLSELGLDTTTAMAHALRLAEEAVGLAPDLPDAHCALGRVLLAHGDDAALDDAIEVFEEALRLDAEHDPSAVGLATALRERGEASAALELVEAVLKRGNPRPQPLLLRALLRLDGGETQEARKDLERAARLAPEAGLLQLEAARAALAAGDDAAAQEHQARARTLLGEAYEALHAALR